MWGDLPDGGNIRKSIYLFELAECHIVMVYSAITNRCHLPDAINNIGGLEQFYTRLNSGTACLSNLVSTQLVVHDLLPTIGIHWPCWTFLDCRKPEFVLWPRPCCASLALVRWARRACRSELVRWPWALRASLACCIVPEPVRCPLPAPLWRLELLPRWPRASLACFSSSICLSLSTFANASRHSAEMAEISLI